MSPRPTLDVVAHAVGDGATAAITIDSAAGAIECRLRADALVAFADRLAGVGLEVQWIAAADTRATSRHFTLVYHFAPPSHRPAVTASVDVDDAFRASEPPTHDDWVPRAVPDNNSRRFVNIALNRIEAVCREAAGYDMSGLVVPGVDLLEVDFGIRAGVCHEAPPP